LGFSGGATRARARFTARLAPDVAVAAGERVRLRVDPERLHFFDPDTTLALR
jgi:ABC-type sugar transport system ATPase subunit